jgi:hypothetical protein
MLEFEVYPEEEGEEALPDQQDSLEVLARMSRMRTSV